MGNKPGRGEDAGRLGGVFVLDVGDPAAVFRRALMLAITAVMMTTMLSTTKMTESQPWIIVLRTTASMAAWVLAVPKEVLPSAPEVLPRIFEPFFTTKQAGAERGTGLGLTTVSSIAEQEGWGLAVDTATGQGAVFRLWLPADTGA